MAAVPSGPVNKNSPSNAGESGLIPGWGTKIPHALGQLSRRVTTKEPVYCNTQDQRSCVPQLRLNAAKYINKYF